LRKKKIIAVGGEKCKGGGKNRKKGKIMLERGYFQDRRAGAVSGNVERAKKWFQATQKILQRERRCKKLVWGGDWGHGKKYMKSIRSATDRNISRGSDRGPGQFKRGGFTGEDDARYLLNESAGSADLKRGNSGGGGKGAQ